MKKAPVKMIVCSSCGKAFDESMHLRQCSNCFACTGCEIYTCPYCGATIEIVPMKPMNNRGKSGATENLE